MMHFNCFLQVIVFITLLQGLYGFSFLKGPPKVNGISKLPKNHGLKLPSIGGGGIGGGGNGNPPKNNDYFTVIAQGEDEGSSIVKLLKGWFQAYNRSLLTHPYLTKIISSAIVGGLGDILIQFWLPYSKGLTPKFDLRRFLVFTSVAGFYIAPVLHVWFNYLNYFPVPSNFNRVAKSLVMIFLDQTIGAVVVNGGFFFAFELAQRLVPPYSEGLSLPAIWQAGSESVRRNMWKTLVMNWYSWPIINFLNFLYVPIQFRLLVSNVAAVFWNMFLSNTANS